MDISLQSLMFFIIITIVYFTFPSVGKPELTLDNLTTEGVTPEYYSKNLYSLGFYLSVVVISQFFLNIGYLIAKCGGAVDKNIGTAALFTFIPWILIFGVLIAILIIFPGFKSAFSDVIGYYAVANSANDIFGTILLGSDLNEMIEKTDDITKKNELTKAAEAIVKICGNKSILINQMNQTNFLKIWDTLKPLMTPGSYENLELKQQLLNLVTIKDNVGEAMWYIYTAILISSIVYYNLASRGCVKSVEQLKAEQQAYNEQREEVNNQAELASTTYTIS